jgi:hypothetical protein
MSWWIPTIFSHVSNYLLCIYRSVCLCFYLWIYSPLWTWPLFQFLNLYTFGGTPWTGDQPVLRPLTTHRINAQTGVHASSGIRTHDPSIRAHKDGLCVRPRSQNTNSVLMKDLGRTNGILSFHMTRTEQKTTQQTIIRCRWKIDIRAQPAYWRDIWNTPLKWLRCYDIHTLFCDDRFRHSKVYKYIQVYKYCSLVHRLPYFYATRKTRFIHPEYSLSWQAIMTSLLMFRKAGHE